MSTSNKLPLADYRLKNVNNALYVDGNDDVVMRTGFAGNIVISGNVNIPGTVQVESSHEHPVHTHTDELGNIDISNTWMPVAGNVNAVITSIPEVEIKNDVSNPIPVTGTINVQTTSTQGKPWLQQVAEGTVANTKFAHIAGYNPDIDLNNPITPETIWSSTGLYPWSAFSDSGNTIYFISTSTSDVGCQFMVQGLDANWLEQTEIVTLNGTTAVTGTKTWTRINNMTIASANVNVGTVTARTTNATGTIVDLVLPGEGYNATGIYTIPAGKTGYLMVGDASVSKSDDVTIKMYVREYGKAFRMAHIAEVFESFYRYDFTIPIPLMEKTDIDVRGQAYNDNTRVSCNFDILLVDN